MAEANGTGRMDRIEAALEKLTDNVTLLHNVAKLQRERTNSIEAIAAARADKLDERVDKLVSAIGEFIARLPPPPPREPKAQNPGQ